MDTDLVLGEDTELGYRLTQTGAVFVPDAEARAFHLGPTMRMRDKAPIDRVSHAFVADRIPAYRWLRSHPARQWKVPYLEVVVESDGDPGYEEVRASVDAVLAGTVPDVAVTVAGPWERAGVEGRAPLRDPHLDLTLILGHYAHEGRVRFTSSSPGEPGEPGRQEASSWGAVPYRLRLPAGWAPGEDTLARLLDLATEGGYGLVSVLLTEGPGGAEGPERGITV
ncbi:glycosyltransferase family 2 protein, partial [Streptosporangium algeriense]